MRFSIPVLASILLALTQAAPLIVERDDSSTKNASLPDVKIFATGGTIASKGSTGSQTSGYSIGLTVEDLIEAVPELESAANLEYLQISNIASGSITYEHLIPLSKNITLALEEDGFDGAVVTHGTDSLEETAFFLDLTVISEKPVCVVGAMRPATAISAYGPMNLFQAVTIAGSEEAKGRGTMITMNDRIASGFYTTKMNANTVDTFRATEQGYLGAFVNNDVQFFYQPSRPIGLHQFDISNVTDPSEIPKVVILYSYQGLEPDLITYAVENLGAKGIILAGSGAGSWTTAGSVVNSEIFEKYQIPIVRSHRSPDGVVPLGTSTTAIAGGYLNPQKARMLLQLSLYSGYSLDQIRDVFKGVHGG
jgi:L-asparaginase